MCQQRVRHRHGGFADGEHIADTDVLAAGEATSDGAVNERTSIRAGDRGIDDLAEVLAKRGGRNGQWAFLGSDQAERPVSTSILRSSRLTTCSPFCCAHR